MGTEITPGLSDLMAALAAAAAVMVSPAEAEILLLHLRRRVITVVLVQDLPLIIQAAVAAERLL